MSILLGFEIGTGKPIEVPLGHTVIVGQTQAAGKTTTLEAMVTRSERRAIAFLTKRGESSFRIASPLQPYFRERIDWREIVSLMEVILEMRLDRLQRASIMRVCKAGELGHGKNVVTWEQPKSLAEIHRTVKTILPKARGIHEFIFSEVEELLRIILEDVGELPQSPGELELAEGLNVMDLEHCHFPLQALVVRSVIEWVHHHATDTIVVIPEAWHFAPKLRNTPVRFAAEEFIRQGGALKNFLWLDSQDLAGVASVLLRQCKVWIFGVQRDRKEIERTLENIPASLARVRAADIATLGVGQFIACWERQMFRVYVQPAWMTSAHAQAIARGEEPVDSARAIVREFDLEHEKGGAN